MNNAYKNAQFMQGPQAMHIAGTFPVENSQLGWSRPRSIKKAANPGRLEKNFLNIMDHFFTVIILLSGEEAYETMSIGHIL